MSRIERHDTLSFALQEQVHQLAAQIAATVGAPPLNDQSLLQVNLTRPALVHLTLHDGPVLRGYAQVDNTAVEIAADASDLGELLTAAEAEVAAVAGAAAGDAPALTIWTHGTHSPLIAVLQGRGYSSIRLLHQLRMPLTELKDIDARHGTAPTCRNVSADPITIRAFVPGQDEAAWLALNAAAFAEHDEQGAWTSADLHAREAESWFDPAGFLLAERDGKLLGFHWTKVHPGRNDATGIGEVYVIGVHPQAQGLHLGARLLRLGLKHLQSVGCEQALLYVDGSNSKAIALYERTGFTEYDRDVQWRRDTQSPEPGTGR